MSCAGSLFFKDLYEEPAGEAAKEGTAAGEYLERILTAQPIPTHARNGNQFTDEMQYLLPELAKEITSLSTDILCEQKIDWQTKSGIWIKGQYDASFVVGDTLYIDDLKYGWGIVEPEKNWQLLGYAIGEVIRRGVAYPKIVMRIHQPRPHHEAGPTRAWTITYRELLNYKDIIEARMYSITEGEKSLATGEHCRYCPAAAGACPASNKAFYRGVDVVHEFLQDTIDDEELSFQLDLVDRINEIVKQRQGSLTALALDRLKGGKLIPNYTTDQKLGDRKWKTGTNPEVINLMTGKDIVEKVMLSPARAEKIGVPKELIASMVDRPFLGVKLKKCDDSKLADKFFNNKTKGE